MMLDPRRFSPEYTAASDLAGISGPASVALPEGASVLFPGADKPLKFSKMSFAPGSRNLIYGASGSGKTTLLHMIGGLLPPDTGQIIFNDLDLYSLSERRRANIRRQSVGVIFQTLNLLDHLTAKENIELASIEKFATQTEVHAAMQVVGIAELADIQVARLSLGQKQRVAIARILAQKPALVLADEPTSSLDDQHADVVMDALWQISNQATLIMVSHDRRFRERFHNRFAVEEVMTS